MAIKKIPLPLNHGPAPAPTALATSRARDDAGRAARFLFSSFAWDQTAEGLAFWTGVYERLSQIAKDGILKDN